jgi:hypothetical protein
MNAKITPEHLRRAAVVYVRQSTPMQVSVGGIKAHVEGTWPYRNTPPPSPPRDSATSHASRMNVLSTPCGWPVEACVFFGDPRPAVTRPLRRAAGRSRARAASSRRGALQPG